MNNVNKRRLDEWEDEWEKEANNPRHEQPNKAALYSSILEQTHSDIKQTYLELETKLTSLTASLTTLEHSLLEEQAKVKAMQAKHDDTFKKAIERVTTRFMMEQQGCIGTLHENQQDLDQLFHQDHTLATTLDQLLTYFDVHLSLDKGANGDDSNQSPEALITEKSVAVHNELEKRYVNAKSLNKAQQARSQVLSKEIQKMNTLPQIIPILKSLTESYNTKIQQCQQSQQKLSIPSLIQQVGNLRIKSPLAALSQKKENQQLCEIDSQLRKVYQGYLRQRSSQQLLIYSHEVEMNHLLSYQHALLAYQLDLQKEDLQKEDLQKEVTQSLIIHSADGDQHAPDDSDEVMESIKRLLISHKKSDINSEEKLLPTGVDLELKDEQIVKAVQDLVAYEQEWNKQWSEDTNDNLDAIQLLDQSKHELARSLFGDASSRDKLTLKPKSYGELQWALESVVDELHEDANTLDEQYQQEDDTFQRRRSFVSLFFTDPFTFESKIEAYIDKLGSHSTSFVE